MIHIDMLDVRMEFGSRQGGERGEAGKEDYGSKFESYVCTNFRSTNSR